MLLERIRHEKKFGASVPLTYAGRLDPMAEGVMIILSGEMCKEKDRYLALDKTYRFDILCGIATDTYDVLGMPMAMDISSLPSKEGVMDAARAVVAMTLPYPPYSSRTIHGVPLFTYARQGTLPYELPLQPGRITTLSIEHMQTVPLVSIIDDVMNDIQKVKGDFRQTETHDAWQRIGEQYPDREVTIITAVATVTSGMYIRSIAQVMGELMGIPSLAYRIVRTHIGDYTCDIHND